MEKYQVFNSIPEEFKSKKLGEGSTAICYLTEDNNVYKEYYK